MEYPGSLLFFTYADTKYDFFAVPYAYFALRNNPHARVEICLEDVQSFFLRQREAVEALEKIFPGRALFRQSDVVGSHRNIVPNTVRFVEQPVWISEYIYIGDIDLLVFDDVLKIHLELIEDNKLPFSNILRREHAESKAPRLSGLHFCKYSDYYPLPDVDDLSLDLVNDEHVLYEIMKRKGYMVPIEFQTRPECGIHMSLNRDPIGRSTGPATLNYSTSGTHGWGGRHYYSRLLEQIVEEGFAPLIQKLDFDFRVLLLAAEALATNQLRKLHRAACAYFIDKRLIISDDKASMKDLLDRRANLIREKDFAGAEVLGLKSLVLWPRNVEILFKQAWLWLVMGSVERAVEILDHLVDLPGGTEYLSKSDLLDSKREQINSILAGAALLRRLGK